MVSRDEIRSYRDLKVWNDAMDMAVDCYKVTRGFPREELYGLVAQIRRSSVSVPANIAEGFGRDNVGSYVHHLRIAQGSLKELETHVILAGRVNLLTSEPVAGILDQADRIGRMLRSLIRSLQASTEKPQ